MNLYCTLIYVGKILKNAHFSGLENVYLQMYKKHILLLNT